MSQLSFTPQVCEAGPFRGYAKLHWIRTAAESRRDEVVGSLFHHLTVDNLRQAFRELDGSRASGVDGVTKKQYHATLEDNLRALHSTIRCGGWRPRPSREVLIPKPQGGTRPLAVGCLEDKIVQTLTARILEAVYEPLFHRHSYGFRRGKSAHQALGRLVSVINARNKRKLRFNPLPLPPRGDALIDVTSEHRAVRKHQPKSRMREIRTSGSVRSLSPSIGGLRFT